MIRNRQEKGITLIALVITIIVLLILAGVTISMVLGDDGIIAQATQAKKANEESSLKDAVSVAKGEAALAQYVEQTPVVLNNLEAIKTRIDNYNTANPTATYTYNNTVAKLVDGVPIPVGFAYVEGTKKDTGLIVVDGYGNEFVWVPVDGKKVQLALDDTYGGDIGAEEDDQDYKDMVASVEIYGGFYVGRYETSWTGSRVASIPNVISMSGSTIIGESGADWYTFDNKQKELYNKESDSVVSGMIYGSQWDAIMDWMSDVVNPNAINPDYNVYIFDSTDMGHYLYDVDWNLITDEKASIRTGSNSAYAVKNIFDLAGNYLEWTQEAHNGWLPFYRGGGYDGTGDFSPASYRGVGYFPDDPVITHSSRLQLYIK